MRHQHQSLGPGQGRTPAAGAKAGGGEPAPHAAPGGGGRPRAAQPSVPYVAGGVSCSLPPGARQCVRPAPE